MRGSWCQWCPWHGVPCAHPTLPRAVLTLSLTTSQGGIFWFTLIDTYSTGFGLIIVALFMCLGIAFCYGERSGWPWGTLQPALGGCGGVQSAWGCGAASPGALPQGVYSTGQPLATTLPRLDIPGAHSKPWPGSVGCAGSCGQLGAGVGRELTPILLPTRSSALQGDGAKPRCNCPCVWGMQFPLHPPKCSGCSAASTATAGMAQPQHGVSWVPQSRCTPQSCAGGRQGPGRDHLPGCLQA